jgi:hypothetical protein
VGVGIGVAVGGTGVAVGGTGVAVGGTGVGVLISTPHAVRSSIGNAEADDHLPPWSTNHRTAPGGRCASDEDRPHSADPAGFVVESALQTMAAPEGLAQASRAPALA